jgi:hypothetical protein
MKVRFDVIGDYKLLNIAALIRRYPRLLICGMSYAQISKHHTRLLDYLKIDHKLHDALSQPLSVTAQDKAVDIQPAGIAVSNAKFSTDPDYVYEDCLYNPDCDAIPEDVKLAKWQNETCDVILDESLLNDDVADELLKELENFCITEKRACK